MAKIHTLEELQTALDEELVWRKRELAALKTVVTSGYSSVERTSWRIRAGIALLYAHWEGFIKAAGTAYLVFVGTQRLSYEELASNFIALAMKSKLNLARDTNRATIYSEVSEFFLSGLSERCSVPTNIETRSNLSSEVLREILCELGLDYVPYATKAKLIDEELVRRRNQIAHGEYLLVDIDEFVHLHQAVVEMLDTFSDQISNAACLQQFKRSPNGRSQPVPANEA